MQASQSGANLDLAAACGGLDFFQDEVEGLDSQLAMKLASLSV